MAAHLPYAFEVTTVAVVVVVVVLVVPFAITNGSLHYDLLSCQTSHCVL